MISLNNPPTGSECQLDRVRAVRQKLNEVLAMAATIPDYVAKMCNSGQIVELESSETPQGKKYDCTTLDSAEMVLGCLTLRIILNRMHHELITKFGDCNWSDDDGEDKFIPIVSILDEENRGYGLEVAKFVPYLRDMGPVIGGLLTMPLHLALEGSDPQVREYLMAFLSEINDTLQILPKGIGRLEQYLLDRARVLTGRQPMHCTLKAMDGRQLNPA